MRMTIEFTDPASLAREIDLEIKHLRRRVVRVRRQARRAHEAHEAHEAREHCPECGVLVGIPGYCGVCEDVTEYAGRMAMIGGVA